MVEWVCAYIGMGCVYRQYMAEAITPPSFRRKEDLLMDCMKDKQNEIEVAIINAGGKKSLACIYIVYDFHRVPTSF